MNPNDFCDYSNFAVPLKLYRIDFYMAVRGRKGERRTFSITYPAPGEEEAKWAIVHICWGISAASANQLLTPAQPVIKISEVE